jgi:hypothetical protein
MDHSYFVSFHKLLHAPSRLADAEQTPIDPQDQGWKSPPVPENRRQEEASNDFLR